MQTFVLSDQTAAFPIGGIIQQAAGGGVEVRDHSGRIVAFVLSPADHEAWLDAHTRIDFEEQRGDIEAALARRGGITTAELLAKAAALAEPAEPR